MTELTVRNAQIIRQVRSGKPKNKVAAHFGLTASHVSHILKRLAPELGKFGGKFYWSDSEAAMLADLSGQGLTYFEIAKKAGWTRSKVAGKLYRLRNNE